MRDGAVFYLAYIIIRYVNELQLLHVACSLEYDQ